MEFICAFYFSFANIDVERIIDKPSPKMKFKAGPSWSFSLSTPQSVQVTAVDIKGQVQMTLLLEGQGGLNMLKGRHFL